MKREISWWVVAPGTALFLATLMPMNRLAAADEGANGTLVIVVGAAGTPAHGEIFAEAAGTLATVAEKGGVRVSRVGLNRADGVSDRDQLAQLLRKEAAVSKTPLWLVLIGHGTFDGREAKLNLRGADVSSKELAAWLVPIHRPLVVVNTASASAPFIADLSGPGRVIVSATQSGREQSATRFARHFAAAIADPAADLDKDGQASLLEAWLTATGRVRSAFEEEGLLASEHGLLDDNGDGKGTPATFFEGLRPSKKAAAQGGKDVAVDGARAHGIHLVASEDERSLSPALRRRRDELEAAIGRLRAQRDQLSVDEYYRRLDPLALELARLYDRAGSPR